MARNISFALTTPQFLDRTKDVTRRVGWKFAKEGDKLMGCVKCMGLRPGEQIERLGLIEIVDARREALSLIEFEPDGPKREGFPEMTGREFVEMFCRHMGGHHNQIITRIEYKYL